MALTVALVIIGALLAVLVVVGQAPPTQWMAFTNVSGEPVEVRVGGDRLLIIAPGATQYLPVSPRAWAWPRRIEVRRYPDGTPLLTWRADLNDLAQSHWRVRIP